MKFARKASDRVIGHAVLSFAVCALVHVASTAPSHAEGLHPFLGQEAAIKKAGRPKWLKEGIRLSYESGDSIRGRGPNSSGSGGLGIAQIDIVAVGRKQTAMSMRTLLADPTNPSQYGLGMSMASIVEHGRGGVWWIHPTVLKAGLDFHKSGSAGWQASAGQIDGPNGKKINGVIFTYDKFKEDGVYVAMQYELERGILVNYVSRTRTDNTDAGATHKLLNVRKRTMPWFEGRPPAWIFKTKSLTYSGASTMRIPYGQPMSQPFRVTLPVTHRGANFIACKLANQQPGQNSYMVSGPSMGSGLWVPPLGIRNLKQGQVLDKDPIAKSQTFVHFVGRSNYGRNIVTISEKGTGFSWFADFELETGAMLKSTLNKDNTQTISMTFAGRD